MMTTTTKKMIRESTLYACFCTERKWGVHLLMFRGFEMMCRYCVCVNVTVNH